MQRSWLSWRGALEQRLPRLAVYLASLIWRMLPDHAGHGWPIGWVWVLSTLLQEEGEVYYWGQTILAKLYHNLHMCTYWIQHTVGPGLTLLMVWSWEHIGVTHPITRQET